jgi:hypothetical protein
MPDGAGRLIASLRHERDVAQLGKTGRLAVMRSDGVHLVERDVSLSRPMVSRARGGHPSGSVPSSVGRRGQAHPFLDSRRGRKAGRGTSARPPKCLANFLAPVRRTGHSTARRIEKEQRYRRRGVTEHGDAPPADLATWTVRVIGVEHRLHTVWSTAAVRVPVRPDPRPHGHTPARPPVNGRKRHHRQEFMKPPLPPARESAGRGSDRE